MNTEQATTNKPDKSIWQRLTEPADAIQGDESRRRARWLSSALLIIIFLIIPLFVFVFLTGIVSLLAPVMSMVAIMIAYGLSRTRYLPAALLTVGVFPAYVFSATISRYDPAVGVDTGLFFFLVAGVLVSSLFLSVRWTIVVAAVDIVGLMLLPVVIAELAFSDLATTLMAVIFTFMLIVVVAILRRQDLQRIEQQLITIRQAEQIEQIAETERRIRERLETTVSKYMAFVEQVAGGNLASRLQLDGNEANDDLYRLGVNLNVMAESLAGMAKQVSGTATAIAAATVEIQAAATQQVASATEQDVTVTQTVATVEEVRTTVMQTAERAQAVASASLQSVAVSLDGQEAVSNTIGGMETIQERVNDIAENILILAERTQQIGEIIDTVNALADQSKMLALNASIEAARAGEEGKGFAVVAMEVRQLAEQSREATSRVQGILGEIQQATNTAVMVTEEGSKGAESGMVLVELAGEAIRDLTGTIEVASQAAAQIAASTHQQTNGMDQLASAMGQIQQASAQTAASTAQTEQSVHDLIEMARQLEEAAARYQLT